MTMRITAPGHANCVNFMLGKQIPNVFEPFLFKDSNISLLDMVINLKWNREVTLFHVVYSDQHYITNSLFR